MTDAADRAVRRGPEAGHPGEGHAGPDRRRRGRRGPRPRRPDVRRRDGRPAVAGGLRAGRLRVHGGRLRLPRTRGGGAAHRVAGAVSRRWTSRSCGTSPATGSSCTSATRAAPSGIPPRPEPRRLGSVDRVTRERGWAQHEQAVERLRASYAAIPPDQPVRLAKRTSNLFRSREANRAPGLDVVRARRRDRGRHRGGHGRRPGHVHLRAPRRGDAAARADPAGRAAAAHDHARRRGDRPRHRVHELPQRPAARVRHRDGRVHRHRRGGDGPAGRRPVRRVRELLRLARLRHPADHPARAGARPRRPAARPLRRRRAARQDDGRDLRDR